ncbi:nitroreductase [Biscogniauxia marginata]|nr:nitroreductase [Biscogniauxia marginata]
MTNLPSLVEARYGITNGGTIVPDTLIPNPTLETLLQHKSVRHFLPQTLPPGTLDVLVAAAQSAATSSNLQTWSVVAIEDPARKDKAAKLCGDQDFIRQAALLLVFCADLNRLTKVSQQHQMPGSGLEFTEMFLMASIDASLAGQNAVVAAQALRLGACYVGAARNKPRELAELLHLPSRAIALFGIAVGKPDPAQPVSIKPRLSQTEVLHRETWDDGEQTQNLASYDKTLTDFNARQARADTPSWTYRSAHRIATVESLHGRDILREVLQERGFNLR